MRHILTGICIQVRDVSNKTFEEWNRATGGKKLPERVTPKARTKGKSAAKTKARRTHS